MLLAGLLVGLGISWLRFGKAAASIAGWNSWVPPLTDVERRYGMTADPETAAALSQKLPSPYLVAGTIREEMQRVARAQKFDLLVEYKSWLDEAETRIEGDFSGLTIEQALLKMAAQAKPGDTFRFIIEDHVAQFGEFDENRIAPRTIVYDVTDLAPTTAELMTLEYGLKAKLPIFAKSQREGEVPSIRPFNTGKSQVLVVSCGTRLHRDLERYLQLQKQRLGAIWFAKEAVPTVGIAVCLALAFGSLAAWRAGRRSIAQGLCVVCGYDLRESPERCPECGRVKTATA